MNAPPKNRAFTFGKVGEVYTTKDGMEIANAQETESIYAWMQISERTRMKVELTCISGHIPYYAWRLV